jgi:hypothetical protein
MDTKPKMGRPEVDPAARKKNRAISLTDNEYERLKAKAKADKCASVSAYIIKLAKIGD